MKDRVNISSIVQLSGYAQQNPTILNIAAFSSLNKVLTYRADAGCKPCKARAVLANYRPQFEAAMSVLTDLEQTQLKSLLDTKQICYNYKAPNGAIKVRCF